MVFESVPQTPRREAAKRVPANLLASVFAFAYMFSKQAGRVSKKLKPKTNTASSSKIVLVSPPATPKSPMMIGKKPKQLLTTISNKAITFIHKRNKTGDDRRETAAVGPEDEWGDGGVWQRSILMGGKCQPLDFSGAIFYDNNGNKVNELPIRSPRASPLPGYLERAKNY
ncbi:hypothetical protein UlMin_008488 [Ulmus minor]